MYCILNEKKQMIAFHDELRVVELYKELIQKNHGINLEIRKIKKNYKKHIKDFDDLYLVKYGEAYVQSGYLLYLQLTSNQSIDDMQSTKDTLLMILETRENLTRKEEKNVKKVVELLDDLITEDSSYVPDLDTLKSMKQDYDPYFYNHDIWS